MWNGNDKIMAVFNKANDGGTKFPCRCPICQNRSAHVYIHRHNDKHCGIWTWCSECGAASHMSGEAPTWWANPDFVDTARLCSDPSYLNEMADAIDEWVNSLVPAESSGAPSPFVMENRFDVVLKEEIQGVPAGTVGTIVIRDDFRTVRIDFVDTDGKTISINEAPEKLIRIVEVVAPINND